MRYFGLNLGHDTGIAVFDHSGELCFYAETERYGPRNKHHLHDILPIIQRFPELRIKDGDMVVVCSKGENNTGETPWYDPNYIRFGGDAQDLLRRKITPNFIIDHHLAHAFSSWCFRPDDNERLFLAYDGAGPGVNGKMKSSLVGNISLSGFSIIEKSLPILTSSVVADLLGQTSAGKAMGLSGYVKCSDMEWNYKNVAKLIDSFYEKNLHKMYGGNTTYCRNPNFADIELTQEEMIWISKFYKFVTKQICSDVFENIRNFSHGRGVVIAGGSALALEVNTQIYNLTKDVVFGPPVDDSGLALGAAAFAYWHVNKRWPKKISSPSLNELQTSLPKTGPQTIEAIAKKLASNKTIGLLRGKAEAGPRALGFRSILASAMDANNLKAVSQDLKGREHYRPLAPMVTEEAFDRYFVGPKGKYMQYRVECTEEARQCLPAIVHKDNSARPQVVSKNDDPWLHDLLSEYGELTGHPCLINTSLNGRGKPICNTLEDALNDFSGKNIEFISIPKKSMEKSRKICYNNNVRKNMKFIGYNPNHDNSVVVFNEQGQIEFYGESERHVPRKKQTNELKPLIESFPNLNISENDLIVTVPCGQKTKIIPDYDDSLVRKVFEEPFIYNGKSLKPTYVIDHHLAHAISSWCFREDNNEKLFLTYDGAGHSAKTESPAKSSLVGIISEKDFYKIENADPIHSTIPIAGIINNENSAGKAMGLAGYYPEVPPMEPSGENILKLLKCCTDSHTCLPQYCTFKKPNEDDLKFIASFYKFMIEEIWKKIEKNIKQFRKNRGVVIGGGTALALEINTRIHKLAKGDVTFGPPINDSGLALGAAAFAFFHKYGQWPPALKTASLQSLQKPLPQFGPQEPKEIAGILAKNIVVGLLRGKAEVGPRALGFRSILASAMDANNLKAVSQDLKGREYYRPLAPMVTEEAFDRYFVGPKGKYMQYRVECTAEARECLPAIVHKDNSARPQVVSKNDDPWLHDLLSEYGELTGHPCLINTSLNKKNTSICNTFEDALYDFNRKKIKIISIKYEKI